jgi:high-affinity K+ transport system ATPase subunit B
MSHHATRTRKGPAEVATLVVLAALLIVFVAGLTVFWATAPYDVGALAHTLTVALILAAIAATLARVARTARGLLRSYRGQS